MSYTYTLKSKCLNTLNDVLKKITITENAKIIKNPLLEADSNFTSIVQSENQFDPSKINSNVLADETTNQDDEKKIEKKNKLKTMVLNKIKQSLEISDDLQAILQQIDDINKDTNLNEWVLNEKGNTAELKSKNATIFKQNDQLCLSHSGKIEIFHSVSELHDWLNKNNFPLPKNIKLHESVKLKEADDDFDSDNDYLELSDEGEKAWDDIFSKDDEPKNHKVNRRTNFRYPAPPEKFKDLKDRHDYLKGFYGNGLASVLTDRHNFTKSKNNSEPTKAVPDTTVNLDKMNYYSTLLHIQDKDKLTPMDIKFIQNPKFNDIDIDASIENVDGNLKLVIKNTREIQDYIEDLKYSSVNSLRQSKEKIKHPFDNLDVTLELTDADDFKGITGFEDYEESSELTEDLGGTTVSDLGSDVQYLANKKLEETDQLNETVLIANGPNGEENFKYYGWDEKTGNLLNSASGAPKLANREYVVNYWMNILERVNDHARNNNLSNEEKRLYQILSNSGMMDKTNPNSFISKLYKMHEDNFTVDQGQYQYNLKNAKLGKTRNSFFNKRLNARGETEYDRFDDKFTILPDIYHDFNTKDPNKLFFKSPEDVKTKLKELKAHLEEKNDIEVGMPYDFNLMTKWFLLPEFVKKNKNRLADWIDGSLYVYGPNGENEVTDDMDEIPEDAYSYNTIRKIQDQATGKTKILPEFERFLAQFKKAMVDECYKHTAGYKKIDNMYEQLNNLINKKVHEVNTELTDYAEVEKNKETKKLYTTFTDLIKNKKDLKPFVYDTLTRFIYTSKVKNDIKLALLKKMVINGQSLRVDNDVLEEIRNLCNRFEYINKNSKKEASNISYNLELLKQDLANINTLNETNYNLDLLVKDLQNNQRTLTEDESPEDFASGIDLNLDTGSSDSSGDATATASSPDLDMDTDMDSADSGTNYGDINIGNFGGEYGPDDEEQGQMSMEPESQEKIIDVLEDEKTGDIKVKVQNLDTDQITLKDLSEIDV